MAGAASLSSAPTSLGALPFYHTADALHEALQELECKVLRNLRPQLEEVRRATSSRHQTKTKS